MVTLREKNRIIRFVNNEVTEITTKDIYDVRDYYNDLYTHKEYHTAELTRYLLYAIATHKSTTKNIKDTIYEVYGTLKLDIA